MYLNNKSQQELWVANQKIAMNEGEKKPESAHRHEQIRNV